MILLSLEIFVRVLAALVSKILLTRVLLIIEVQVGHAHVLLVLSLVVGEVIYVFGKDVGSDWCFIGVASA